MKHYIDVGAYNGDSVREFLQPRSRRRTFLPRDDAPTYRIIAIEPCATNLKLRESCPTAEVIEKVAWTHDGHVDFYEVPPPHSQTVASCVASLPFIGDRSPARLVPLPCFDFPRYLADLESEYTVVKMNAETSEYLLLPRILDLGARVDELYVEFHHLGHPEWDARRGDITRRLEAAGVQVFDRWWR